MKKPGMILVLMTLVVPNSVSQIIVSDDNNVGIGTSSPQSKLSINNEGESNSTMYVSNEVTGSNQRAANFYKSNCYGNYTFSVNAKTIIDGGSKLGAGNFTAYASSPMSSYRTFGVRGVAGNATSGYNYGVFGYLIGSNNGAAIFAATPGKNECNVNGIYAGYFRGDVIIEDQLEVDGINVPSDINVKKDIRLLSTDGARETDRLMTLSAIKFKLKNPAELGVTNPYEADTISYVKKSSDYTSEKYTRDRIGLSAQEVREVYPELVKESNQGHLTVDYLSMVPILIEAIKEQDAEIELLKKQLKELQATKQ